VLYRRRENSQVAFPPSTLTWQPEEGILWPEPPAPVRAFWLKSQGLSANAHLTEKQRAAWNTLESSLLPKLHSPTVVWTKFVEGEASRCWLLAAFRFRLPPEQRHQSTIDWIIPEHGTVIHLDVLAIPVDAPQPEAALELAEYLTTPAIQERLAPETGWLPVNQPIGKETQINFCPLPTGNWLDKSEIPYPEQPFPVAPPSSTETHPPASEESNHSEPSPTSAPHPQSISN
jgi:hypothetical protein